MAIHLQAHSLSIYRITYYKRSVAMTSNVTEDLWLFGYGSLIWKPPPHFGQHPFDLVVLDTSIDPYQI